MAFASHPGCEGGEGCRCLATMVGSSSPTARFPWTISMEKGKFLWKLEAGLPCQGSALLIGIISQAWLLPRSLSHPGMGLGWGELQALLDGHSTHRPWSTHRALWYRQRAGLRAAVLPSPQWCDSGTWKKTMANFSSSSGVCSGGGPGEEGQEVCQDLIHFCPIRTVCGGCI